MTVRTLVTTAASTALVGAAGCVLAAAPALAGGADVARASAVTVYDPAEFPATATARVHSVSTPSGRTVVTLTVTGLAPNRTYTSHAHVAPCSSSTGAGGHWQHVVGGPVDAVNEIWLDVTTDAEGNGSSKAEQDFAFSGDHRPESVIIHAGPAAPVPGARIACLTVDF